MILRLAWRNVWRNTRRSGVTLAAMTFALWVMVLYSGLIEGYLANMARDVLDFEIGEVQVMPAGFLDDPSLYQRLPDDTVTTLEAAGFRVTPSLRAGALGASGEQSAGVVLRGVDPAREAAAMRLPERVVEGQWLDDADPKGVVLGRRVAKSLGAHVGAELVVLTQGTDGSMANDLYTVRGVLGTVSDATDRSAVLVPLTTLRELLVVPDGVQQVIVRVPVGEALDHAEDRVKALLPGADVQSWRELMPIVATMIDSGRASVMMVFFIVYVAVGILVLNAMLMAVFERIREFGVMKAIGTGPWLVFRVILTESAILTGLSLVVGLALAVPFALYLERSGLDMSALAGGAVAGISIPPIWYASFTPASVGAPVVILLVVVGLAVTWPALTAARLRPVEAMRYQ
jgi:putative ABC transport system permease protein